MKLIVTKFNSSIIKTCLNVKEVPEDLDLKAIPVSLLLNKTEAQDINRNEKQAKKKEGQTFRFNFNHKLICAIKRVPFFYQNIFWTCHSLRSLKAE